MAKERRLPEILKVLSWWHDGFCLGVLHPLESGCTVLQQGWDGLGTKIGEAEASQIQVLQLTEVRALEQICQV